MGAAGSCAKDRKPPGFKKLEEGLSHLELPKLSNPFDKSEKTEGDKYIDSLEQYVDKNYPFLDKCTDVANPVIKVLVRLVCCVAPLYKFLFQAIYIFYKWAPKCLLQMAIGLSLCFFGGQYLMVLAAIEAWNNTGGKDTMNNLKIVFEEGQAMLKNQRAPTSFVPPGEALQQSTIVALKSVKDPKRLEVAVGGLWSSYLAVIATLRMQFARTVALALGIADNIKKPLTKAITPALEHLTGPELKQWISTIVTVVINSIAVFFAWKVQEVISAYYSGLRGGRLFALGLFDLIVSSGWDRGMPAWLAKCFDHENSYLDEVLGWALAAAGIYVQFTSGFDVVPFPVDIVFYPLDIIEWLLRYQVTFSGASPTGHAGAPIG